MNRSGLVVGVCHGNGWGVLAVVVLVALSLFEGRAGADLTVRVEELVAVSGLRGSDISVEIIDAETGESLGGVGEHTALIPASNMKLFATGGALATLGPSFVFKTELLHDAERNRLIVRASGDPAFADPVLLEQMGLDVEELLDIWVEAWMSASTARPSEVVIDDRVFDTEFVHPTWPVQQLNRWYCAEVAGLNFHTNVIAVYASPEGRGARPTLEVTPKARWLEIENEARSVTTGDQTLWASRGHETNRITMHGDVRWSGAPVRVTVHDPPIFFGRVLADRLSRSGAEGRGVTVRRARADESFDGARVLHTVQSSMATVLERTNADSFNLYAEALIKRMGHEVTNLPGSWSDGTAVLRMLVGERVGSRAAGEVSIADGSGMSRENRASAHAIAAWLGAMLEDERVSEAFVESLPTVGEGTLKRWFRNRPVRSEIRAKTGTLTGASGLSGYVIDRASGRKVIVATIVNDWPSRASRATVRRFQEDVFLIADAWLSARVDAEERVGG